VAPMNICELTCIALGMLFNALTFALGCAVGVSVSRRKESTDDNSNRKRNEAEGFHYYPPSKN
jgi:hypothetical protein